VKLISSCWAPSDLYTSIIPALLVDGISEAIRGANGKCAFVMNLTTKTGETEGYPASCFCKAIEEELGQGRINAVIMNNEAPTDELIHEYVEISRTPLVVDDLDGTSYRPIRTPLLSEGVAITSLADKLERRLSRHDTDKLAQAPLLCT